MCRFGKLKFQRLIYMAPIHVLPRKNQHFYQRFPSCSSLVQLKHEICSRHGLRPELLTLESPWNLVKCKFLFGRRGLEGVFSNELALRLRSPKYWSFSFSISPSSKYSGLISFRIDWFDLLSVQETLKNLLQNHNLKASFLWHLAFFITSVHDYWRNHDFDYKDL